MPHSNLHPLLEPASIAVVGASTSPEKPGHILLRNILDGGFPGRVYPINPRGGTIADLPAYPSVVDVPEPVDLAFIVVARERVLAAVGECAAANTRAVCIITAGFGEGDDWGRAEQQRVTDLIANSGMIGIGPNTIGTISMGGRLLGSFVPFPRWEDGHVAIVAQTGIFAGAVALELMSQETQRIGIHASVDIGNRVGIDELALIHELADRPEVRVLGCYLETLADPREFLALAAEIKRAKPIIILKPGRTHEGSRASASHTGALAQDYLVLDDLLAQHGVIRAEDAPEFLALLRAFSFAPLPTGPQVGIITYSGALGVIATDQVVDEGLSIAPLEPSTQRLIGNLMPTWQSAGNPIDLWSAVEVDAERTARIGFDAVLADPNLDQVLAIMLAVPNADFAEFRTTFETLRATHPGKPIHMVMHGRLSQRWTRELEGLGIPVYESTRQAVRAMGAMTRYAAGRHRVPTAHSFA